MTICKAPNIIGDAIRNKGRAKYRAEAISERAADDPDQPGDCRPIQMLTRSPCEQQNQTDNAKHDAGDLPARDGFFAKHAAEEQQADWHHCVADDCCNAGGYASSPPKYRSEIDC